MSLPIPDGEDPPGEIRQRPNWANRSSVRLPDLLDDAGLTLDRFIQAVPGTKRPKESWKSKDIGHPPDEVGRDSLVRTGDGLLVVDIDDWDDAPPEIKRFVIENPTLQVQSAHATGFEGHHYFEIDESPFGKNERSLSWGEMKYGALTVTPGSEVHGIRDGADCDDGCCSRDDPGVYSIKESRSIRSISVDDLPIESSSESAESRSGKSTPSEEDETYPVDTDKPDFDWKERLELARKYNSNLDALCDWAENDGNPAKVGFPGDRSGAEAALVTHLGFCLDRNKPAVRFVMNRLNPPKWDERGDSYRDSTIDWIERVSTTWTEKHLESGNEGGPSQELVLDVWSQFLGEHDSFKTEEVAQRVINEDTRESYSPRQTRDALNYLEEKGFVEYRRPGRSGKWYLVDEENTRWVDDMHDELNPKATRDLYLHERNMRIHGKDSRDRELIKNEIDPFKESFDE